MAVRDRDWEKTPPIKTYDYGLALSRGLVKNHQAVVKFGYNGDIDAGVEETVWSMGGEWQPATSAETLNISSTSINDVNTTGSGAWLVAVFGLDGDYNQVSELTIALNGTNTVTTSNSYIAVNRCAVAFSGSTGYNEGTISFTQSSSGLKLAEIPAEEGITQQCVYTVPAGYTGYLRGIYGNTAKTGGGGNPLVEFELYSWNDASQTRYNVLNILEDVQAGNDVQLFQDWALPTAEKNTLFLNCSSDVNNTRVFARFYMQIVKNL